MTLGSISARAKRVGLALALVSATGCISPGPMRVRLALPAGAILTIHDRPGVAGGEVTATMPAVGDFETGVFIGYPVTIVLPSEMSERYGATGAVRLRGMLYVSEITATVRDNVVPIPLPDLAADFDERLGRLVRGETSSFSYETADPNRFGRPALVRVVLGAAPR